MRNALTFAVSIGAVAWSHTTAAQETTQQAGVADIVVTAEKRPSVIQKVAISVAVATPEMLQNAGVTNLNDLAKIAPGLSMSQTGNATMISIRGVSSRDYNETGDPAVAVSIDGMFIQRSTSLNTSFFDLDRVEVLRGPQGTLYGRNATGGAVNIISARPKKDFEASASASYGNYDSIHAEAMVNAPLGEGAILRVAAVHESNDGYTAIGGGKRGDDEGYWGVRSRLLLQPTDRLEVLLTGEYVKQSAVGPVRLGVPLTFDVNGAYVDGPPRIESDRRWNLDHPGSLRVENASARASVQYDLDWLTLNYVGGYRQSKVKRDEDYDGTDALTVGFPQDENVKTQSHELRFATASDRPLSAQGGLYYFEEKNDLLAAVLDGGFGTYVPITTYDYKGSGKGVLARSRAAFLQASYIPVLGLTLEAGIRRSHDTKRRDGVISSVDFDLYYNDGTLIYSDTPQNSRASFSKTNYHLGAKYEFTPKHMVYAKFDTGYKAGGFTELAAYNPENLSAFEIGSKNRFAGNKLQLNASAFYYDYKDQQVLQVVDTSTIVRNAGLARIWGAELEAVATPIPRGRLDVSLSYLHARFRDFETIDPFGNPVQLAGNRPVQSPSLTLFAGYEHEFAVGDGHVTARVQTQLQSSSYLTVYNYRAGRQDAYSRSDATLTYVSPGDRYSVQLFARNIENKRIFAQAEPDSFTGNHFYQFGTPRTYGVRLAVKYR